MLRRVALVITNISEEHIASIIRMKRISELQTMLTVTSCSVILTRLWTPLHTHYLSENLVAPGIELETSVSVARTSDNYTTEAVTLVYQYVAIRIDEAVLYNYNIFIFSTLYLQSFACQPKNLDLAACLMQMGVTN
jgi:hypothetical protein